MCRYIAVTFTGELNDKMAGFYRSAYPAPDGSGETRWGAVPVRIQLTHSLKPPGCNP